MVVKTDRMFTGAETELRLSVGRAAAVLGVSPFTVRKWVRTRLLPHHRCGRRIVLDRRDLEAFLARTRVEARVAIVASPAGGDQ
jgi:excisionase family DNA binding protein